jgi:threonylcarbamoyladenosine tRNA methylthiotransferase MtaB
MRFCTITLGCKVNQYDTRTIEGLLVERGFNLVRVGAGCDVCIVNTCAVTAESVRKSRQAMRQVRKHEPGAVIAVFGCFAQLAPDNVRELGADIIGSPGDELGFVAKIESMVSGREKSSDISRIDNSRDTSESTNSHCTGVHTKKHITHSPGDKNRTRALLKIQDGCDNFCAYCVIPYIRGRSRSLPPVRIAEKARKLQELGYKEIVVTGIEISSWKTDEPSPCLPDAVQLIHEATPGVRLRLGSLDPAAITDEFCQRLSQMPYVCNHFHLSLQSGCDETLRRMGRKYNTDSVKRAIALLRSSFKDCGITADLIVGFHGETDEEFEETVNFIKKAGFSDMHIFQFSPRPKTKAADMPGKVDKDVKRERARIAAEIASRMAGRFREAQVGKIVQVLFEQTKNGVSTGYSSNYLRVNVDGKIERNCIQDVKITNVTSHTVAGVTVHKSPGGIFRQP